MRRTRPLWTNCCSAPPADWSRLARGMLRDFPLVRQREQTADILQEAMLSLTAALRQVRFSSTRDFFGLAAEHIRRRLVDLARYHGRAHRRFEPLPPGPNDSHEIAAPAEDDIDDWQALHEAVAALPAEQREVFSLRLYHGCTVEETAALLKISPRTVIRLWLSPRFAWPRQLRLSSHPGERDPSAGPRDLPGRRTVLGRLPREEKPMTTHEDQVLDLLEQWFDARQHGEPVHIEEVCRNCPELADTLRRQVALFEKLERMTLPIAGSSDPTPPVARPRRGSSSRRRRCWRRTQRNCQRSPATPIWRRWAAGAWERSTAPATSPGPAGGAEADPHRPAQSGDAGATGSRGTAVARLDHPHIVKVFEVGECRPAGGGPPAPYIALEYVPGGSLETH